MKIVHICLSCFYVEGYGYQENILTKIHSQMGNEVTVLTSDFAFNEKNEAIKKEEKDYINKYNVHVKVLDRNTKHSYLSRFGLFDRVYEELEAIVPDIIFIHGGEFVSLSDVIKYCKKHKGVKVYMDQHGDYYNSPIKGIKRVIAKKGLYGHFIRKANKYVSKYWGVTPWRCKYLNDVYGVPKNKIDLLVMGGDDEYIHLEDKENIRKQLREELGIKQDDFVVITGGKIDKTKNFHLLMQAVSEIEGNIKLIVFGTPNNEMQEEIYKLSTHKNIVFIGWLASEKASDYFITADLAVFPGTHSVLWEQACACGIPLMVKDWEGMRHIDIGGNCQFLYEDSKEEIKNRIQEVFEDKKKYDMMKQNAEKGIKLFSYNTIAKKAIELDEEQR